MNHDDHESIGQALNSVLMVLDIIAGRALQAETCDEVAAEEITLGQVSSRVQLILSFIDARRPSKIRVVQ